MNAYAIPSAFHTNAALALMLADASTAALAAQVFRLSMLAVALHGIPSEVLGHLLEPVRAVGMRRGLRAGQTRRGAVGGLF